MFIDAIIYYPTDEKAIKQIDKEIANFHNSVALKYMDITLLLTVQQKIIMLDSLMQDIITQHSTAK